MVFLYYDLLWFQYVFYNELYRSTMMIKFTLLGIELHFNVIAIYLNFYLQSFYFNAHFYKGIDIAVKIQTFFLRLYIFFQ